jgi:hypothetical protein
MKGENPQVYDMKQTHHFHSQLRPQTNQIKQDQKWENPEPTVQIINN